jgi:hypothetical protein
MLDLSKSKTGKVGAIAVMPSIREAGGGMVSAFTTLYSSNHGHKGHLGIENTLLWNRTLHQTISSLGLIIISTV